MKNIRISIDDRIYNNLKEYCYYNKLKINKYIADCVEKALYIDKYGDLNDIFNTEHVAPPKPIVEQLNEKQEHTETIIENKTEENSGMNMLGVPENESQNIIKRVKRQLKRK